MSASKYRGYNGEGMMRLSLRKHGKQKDVNKSLKIALVCSDCLLVSFQPLLVHLSKSADGTFAFDPISVNLLVECVKCVFAVCFIVYTANQPSPEAKALRSVSRLRRAARENLPLAFPSALHAVNNYLKFAMQLYFSPTTVRMLANLKVLVIAVLLKTITRRRFSVIQWEALALLVLGVTVNQMKLSLGASGAGKPVGTLGGPPGPDGVALASSPPPHGRWHMVDQEDAAMSPMALMYTAMFISFPSFASVFNEVTMKKNFETSVSLQMFFSYFWGAVFNLIGLFGVGVYRSWNGGSEGWMPSVFRGHSIVTCLLVANNAAQGVLSTFFFKFADSVMKKHSSNAATIFTALLSAAMFGHTLRANFVVGGAIVLISMHLFYAKPDSLLAGKGESGAGSRKGGLTVSPSMEHFGGAPSRTQSSSSFDSAGSVEGLGTVEEGFGSPTPLGVARSRSGFGGDRESLLPR